MRRFEDLARLRRAKSDALAKRINRIDQPFGVQQRQHAQHVSQVVVGAAGKLGGHGVGTQERCAHSNRLQPPQLPCHGQ